MRTADNVTQEGATISLEISKIIKEEDTQNPEVQDTLQQKMIRLRQLRLVYTLITEGLPDTAKLPVQFAPSQYCTN